MRQIGDVGDFLLAGVESRVPRADDAIDVAHHHVAEAHPDEQLSDGDACGAGAVDDDLDLAHLLPGDLDGVEQGGCHHDGGAVLIVVEHGDVAALLQPPLHLKAAGGGDVLQVDAAEALGDEGDGVHQLVHVLGIHADGKGVHAAELLEKGALALHHRHAGGRTYVAQTQHGGAVGDDGHQIAPAGQVKGFVVVGLDLPAGLGHAGCVQKGQVLPALHMLAGDHLDLAPEGVMQLQRLLADFIHGNTVLSGHTISSGWKTSSNFSGVRKPSFTQASFREMFSLWASLAVLAALS